MALSTIVGLFLKISEKLCDWMWLSGKPTTMCLVSHAFNFHTLAFSSHRSIIYESCGFCRSVNVETFSWCWRFPGLLLYPECSSFRQSVVLTCPTLSESGKYTRESAMVQKRVNVSVFQLFWWRYFVQCTYVLQFLFYFCLTSITQTARNNAQMEL